MRLRTILTRRTAAIAMALVLGSIPPTVLGETSEARDEQGAPDPFGLRALRDRFEAASPAVGKRVPDVSIYTASGEEVRFRDLVEGHYSVVVFGCLT